MLSMFVRDPWNQTEFTKFCVDKYGISPNFDWVVDSFGGKNLAKDWKFFANIVFVNG